MSLRIRLFVWVGVLFLLAFVLSYFLEEYLTTTNLKKAENNIKHEILKVNENKREYFEMFLRAALAKQEAEINVLLDKVAENQIFIQGFQPTAKNLQQQTWLSSSLLTEFNKWLDFVQNTNEGELQSLIAIDPTKVQLAQRNTISPSLAIVRVNENQSYLGIRLQFDRFLVEEALEDTGVGSSNRLRYALFTAEQIQSLDLTEIDVDAIEEKIVQALSFPILISPEAAKSYVLEFVKTLNEAKEYLKVHGSELQFQVNRDEDVSIDSMREATLYKGVSNKSPIDQVFELLNRYDQIDMIWGLTTILTTGIVGHSPFDAQSPIGVARFIDDENRGKAIYNRDVFAEKPLYNFQRCQRDFFENKTNICLDPRMEVVNSSYLKKSFFANSMGMKIGDRTGFLTVGINAGRILKQLALATHETTVLVARGEIISIFSPDGLPIDPGEWIHLPVENIMNLSKGVVDINDTEYFFLHMTPFDDMDFHFFVFNPASQEFALVNSLNENASELIDHISFQMRLASIAGLALVLLFLNNISKRITAPIAKLAKAAELVGQGKLDHIDLPQVKMKHHDEVHALYHTFLQMVEGLRDKEKVRGVLNKVVSREIAEEILKGNVHLGGEERNVTVLFADIRQFTALTEKMPPGEVIELLNTCMTKISAAIDEFGGVIDKYVGDEVMALFGVPVARDDSALKAIQSGMKMMEILKEWNRERQGHGWPVIEMGVGIHTGVVLAGNMGAENRLNYTVLGANVNMSSRLCEMAKPMQVLISGETLKCPGVASAIDIQEVPNVQLKGFTEALTVYEVVKVKSSQGMM